MITYYNLSRNIVAILCFIGIYLGLKHIKKDKHKAILLFTKFAIIPLALNSFITHTFFGGNIIKTSTPFFEIEAGGANLGIVIALIVLLTLNKNITAVSAVLLVYAIYLIVGMISTIIYKNWKSALKFLPIIIMLLYFSVGGIILK